MFFALTLFALLAIPFCLFAREAFALGPFVFRLLTRDPVSLGFFRSQPLAFKALRDGDHFGVPPLFIFPRDEDNWFRMIPLEIASPDHRKFRNILDPMLSPRGVLALEADIKALANQLLDTFADKGECEFTKEFARPLPVMVFLNFMGLPLDRLDQFVKWVVALIQFAEFDRAK